MSILVTPHWRVGSVPELEAVHVRSMGIDGLLLDLDCTLEDYAADGFQARVVTWVAGSRIAVACRPTPPRAGGDTP